MNVETWWAIPTTTPATPHSQSLPNCWIVVLHARHFRARFNLKLSESEQESGRLAMRRRAARLRATVTTNSQRGMRTNRSPPVSDIFQPPRPLLAASRLVSEH